MLESRLWVREDSYKRSEERETGSDSASFPAETRWHEGEMRGRQSYGSFTNINGRRGR